MMAKSVPTTFRLLQLASIVLLFHVAHSLLQEKVFLLPGFHHSLLLSFLQTIAVSIFAVIDHLRQGFERKTPYSYYVVLSVLAVVASFATNEASIRLNYPTQVIFKSSKLLAVMLLRSVMMRHKGRLTALDWASSAAVVIGLVAFTFATHEAHKREKHHHHTATSSSISSVVAGEPTTTTAVLLPSSRTSSSIDATSSFAVGVIAVLVAVAADALLYLVEEKYCFHTFGSTSGEILVFLNAFAAVNAGTVLAISGKAAESFDYVAATGVLVPLVLVYSLCNFIGTSAILSVVNEFGSPSAIIVTSTRKVCTILGSYLVYPKPFTFLHAVGLVLVSGGVYVHEYARKKKAQAHPLEDEEEPVASPV